MKYLVFVLWVLVLFPCNVYAQPWMNNIAKNQLKKGEIYNFYIVQQAFNEYWQNRKIERSKGWKQFKRWEAFMTPRVYPSGNFTSDMLWKESVMLNRLGNNENDIGDWQAYGPILTPKWLWNTDKFGSGRVNCIAFHPTDINTFWIGTPSGGLWKTTDGGVNWKTTTDYLSCLGVSDIAVNQSNPDILYIATGDVDAGETYSIGVLKSIDGGISWDTTGLSYKTSDKLTVARIKISPANDNTLVAATDKGIYLSNDAGMSWTQSIEGKFKDIEYKTDNPSVVFAASYSTGEAQIFRSLDGGKSFDALNTGIAPDNVNRIELAVTPANPLVIYALCSDAGDDGFYGLYKSSNAGNTWQMVTKPTTNLLGWEVDGSDKGGQGWYDLALAISPTSENDIYAGGINIWRSTDGGKIWRTYSHWWYDQPIEYVHADHHSLVFHPTTGDLFSANDGGIYKKAYRTQWKDLSDNLNILQIYRIGISDLSDDMLVAGSQDNGTMRLSQGVWNSILEGDGMECWVDPINPKIIYSELYNGEIYKSINGGNTFNFISPNVSDTGAWVTPFVMSPHDRHTLYVGYRNVYKSIDAGNSWIQISKNLIAPDDDGSFVAMVVTPSDKNVIYVASNRKIWRTDDDGASGWLEITNQLPQQAITFIEVGDNDPDRIWVTLSGFVEGSKIYQSNDGGKNWFNYSEGLPNVPANCVVYQKGESDVLYIGTDIGVFFRNNTMQEWISFNKNLPNVIINELEIQYSSMGNRLIAATYGRGLWITRTLPLANFEADMLEICEGRSITFSDKSSYNITGYQWDFGDGAQPPTATGSGDHTIVYSTSGIKTVSLRVVSADGSDIEKKADFIKVIPENTITIFPNPGIGDFDLKIVSKETGILYLEIFDTAGKLVYKSQADKTEDIFQTKINLTGYYSGMYALRIKQGNRIIQKMLVLQ